MPLNSVLPPPPILPVTALQEQHFNEAALAAPVTHAALRAWTYPEPAVVLGRAQHQLALPAASAGALPVVVRGAGGGAVLTGPWLLSLAITLAPDDVRVAALPVADSYRWLGEAVVAALAALAGPGVQARAQPPAERIPAPEALAWACFAGVAPWEVVACDAAGGPPRKLVGFAQRRSRHGVLLAMGVLLTSCPWLRMTERMGLPASQARAQADALAACTIDLAALCSAPVSGETFLRRLWPRLQPMRNAG